MTALKYEMNCRTVDTPGRSIAAVLRQVFGSSLRSGIQLGLALGTLSLVPALPVAVGQELTPHDSDRWMRAGALTSGPVPPWQQRLQEIGRISVSWNNSSEIGWRIVFVGSQICDPSTLISGIEFPKGSNARWNGVDLWFGGVKAGDTLVSVVNDLVRVSPDDYEEVLELFPAPPPEGVFTERTTRISYMRGPACSDIHFDSKAISEHDLISVATDTVVDPSFTQINPFDQRIHEPLGLRIEMKRYAWSHDYAEDFVLVECHVKNVGFRTRERPDSEDQVKGLMIGIVVEGVVADFLIQNAGSGRQFNDILWDLLEATPLAGRPHLYEPMNLVWVADNDGDPLNGQFDDRSVTSVFGMRLLSPTLRPAEHSFNWWTQGTDRLEWGPIRTGSKVEFANEDRGKPQTDRGKYQLMSNGEIDYPVSESAITHSTSGWETPSPDGIAIADGTSGAAMLSFGPYDLNLGDTVSFALAILGGEDFHTNPLHFTSTFDPLRPQHFMDGLDFSDLLQNARWAAWLYDTPGLDTDGDGFRGDFHVDELDTVWYAGDGVPDFSGPPPPPAPHLTVTTRAGKARVRFNGRNSELSLDPFFNRRDFEGYRVYVSRTGTEHDWRMIAQRDLLNYARYTWVAKRDRWELLDPPFALAELKSMYDSLTVDRYGHTFEPDSFATADVDDALLEVGFDPQHPASIDSLYRYFGPYESNAWPDDRGLSSADSAGLSVTGIVRKLFPETDTSDVFVREDGTEYSPYYEYEVAVEGLHVAEPVFISVTTFDNGDPASNFKPLESKQDANRIEVWPINSSQVVNSERPKPGVYPNPYRLIDDYYSNNWENRKGSEPDRERARQVTFYNVPDTCTLSIWSLDGDLVKKLQHVSDPSSSEATVVRWDLITRNTQAVKTGIYIWSIESRFGTDVGKLVIIK